LRNEEAKNSKLLKTPKEIRLSHWRGDREKPSREEKKHNLWRKNAIGGGMGDLMLKT